MKFFKNWLPAKRLSIPPLVLTNDIAYQGDAENKNLLDILGNCRLNEIVSDWREVVVGQSTDQWLNFPPQEFLDFVASYPKTPFDSIPESENYKKPPSFLVSQAHRIWQTSWRVYSKLIEIEAHNFIDLGSFPFFVPLMIRDFFGFKGEIIATTNLDLTSEGLSFLANKGIQIAKLDLDPFVSDPANDLSSRLPLSLAIEEKTIDFILASHVIEHLYHPRSMVKECFRLLKPGGRLMITTDNAMMIDVFVNYIRGYGYIFEPIEQTAAMCFDFWRGHVRLFTQRDLSVLAEVEGFSVENVDFFHCFYNVIFTEYFKQPMTRLPEWKRRLMRDIPWTRNDIAVTAQRKS